MKKVILSALLASALCVPGVKAQTIHFGPKAGGNLSWVTQSIYFEGDNPGGIKNAMFSFHAGAYGKYMFSDTWGVGVEALYTGMGDKKDDRNKTKLDYLTVPVLAQFHLPSIEGLSFHLGPQVGFLMSAKFSSFNQDTGKGEKDVDVKEKFKDIDFAIVGGAEYAFDFGLTLGARYNFGVLEVVEKEDKIIGAGKHTNQCIQAYVGYNLAKVLAK
ncbi:MAG: PorT family protein [Cytophagales bacterium]|nr:PorT family protein [Cytophagales bacterium]